MSGPTWQDVTSAPEWDDLSAAQRGVVQQKFFAGVVQPNIPEGVDPGDAWKQFSTHTADSLVPKRQVGALESAGRGFLGAASDTDTFARKLVGVGPVLYDAAHSLVSGKTETGAQDAYFKNAVDPSVAYGMSQQIDPRTERQGMGAQLAGAGGRLAFDLPTMVATGGESAVPRLEAGAAELIGNGLTHSLQANLVPGSRNAADKAQQVLDTGGSKTQAALAGGADLLTSTFVNAVPLGVGSSANGAVTRFGMRAATAAPTGAAGTILQNDVSNVTGTAAMHHDLTGSDLASGALTASLLGGVMGERLRAPVDKGSDLLTPSKTAAIATEDPETHAAGVAPDQIFQRGYSIIRGTNGKPFGIAPQNGGDVVPLNGRSVDEVIDGMRKIVPYQTPAAVHVGSGEQSNVIDSTARDVTPKALPAPSRGPPAPTEQLALPAPSDFEVNSQGQARATGDNTPLPHGLQDSGEPQAPASSETTSGGRPISEAEHSWVNIDPRAHPEEFGLNGDKSQGLLDFIARSGGLNLEAFKSQFGSDPAILRDRKANQAVVGKPLFKKTGGMTPDDLREAMQQHGWLPRDAEDAPPTVGADDAHDLLSDALMGKPVSNINDNSAHNEAAIRDIEHAQALARQHLKLASDLKMSPHGLEQEVERHRGEGMPTDVKGMSPADAHQAMSIDDLESLAHANGVDPKATSDAFYASKSQPEFASKLGDLIAQARQKNGTDTGTTESGTSERAGADKGGQESVQPSGGQDQINDAGAEGGVRSPGEGGTAAGRTSAPENAGQVDAFGAATSGERNRAAIAAKDAQRNSGTRADTGDGGLFDGPRPQQDSFASRVGMRAAKGVAVQRAHDLLRQRFGRVADMLLKNNKLHVVADASDLPRGMEHLSSDDGLLQGVHDRRSGESWIVANSLTEHNVTGVAMHEVGVHAGLAKLLGVERMGRLAGQLRVIGETGKPAEKAHVGEALRRVDNEPTSKRDEELVAHSIELLEAARQGESITPRLKVWLADVVSHIKAGLYNMGFLKAKHLNLNDIRHLAEGALKRVARGTIPEKSSGAVNEQLKSSKAGESAAAAKSSDAGAKDRPGGDVAPEPGATRAAADDVSRPSAEGIDSAEVDTSDAGAQENLKKWFGAGVLKDGSGKPLVFYRADDHDLTSWDHERAGAATGSAPSALGMFLTRHPEMTEGYGEKMISGYARLKNPAHENLADAGKQFQTHEEMAAHRAELEAKGHDGIVFDDADQVAVFDPNHDFKRSDNHGTYDENTPHFMFSKVKPGEKPKEDEAPPKESAVGKFRVAAGTRLGELAHAFFMRVTPMADNHASPEARAIAKDFANIGRMAAHEYTAADKALKDGFTPEQQERMWKAANEQSELLQRGLPTKGKGLDTLTPVERAAVEHEQARSQEALQAAIEAGLFDGARNADGSSAPIPSYVPRMVIRRLAGVVERFGKSGETGKNGANVRTSSPGLLARKHLLNEDTEAAAKARDADAEVIQNIRTLPLATKRMWDAVAGRRLINAVRDAGTATGEEYMRSGARPGDGWFTLDHPAFTEYVRRTETDPDTGKTRNALDEFHEPIYDSKPIWIRKDFEGPLKAVMSQNSDAIERLISEIKVKTMSGIMISPAIHLMTELGRAVPAMPGKFLTGKVFSAGKATLADAAAMREAIEVGGVAPIAGRGGSNDAVELANERNIKPGRSWTSQVLAVVPGLFDAKAGEAVKRTIDKWGDFWHNTLLWDQIAKLQMGLYSHFRDEAIKDGFSRADAVRMAGHEANRFAGTLPKEATSVASRQLGNLLMFSRTFTLGNWGVMKDALKGLPRDVQAQILRDSGANGLARAQSYTTRRSRMILAADIGLMYIGNALLQNFFAVATGGSSPTKEMQGYLRRAQEWMSTVEKNPLEAFHLFGDLSPTHDNEPGKQDRILVGHQSDGTAIYLRNPFGKIGEEFLGWSTNGLDMIKRKLSPLARPVWETLSNDKDGFGTKVYNPKPRTDGEWWENAGKIVKNLVMDQLNTALVTDTKSILAGDKDAGLSALKLAGNLTGFTASKGAPGGEAVGAMYAQKNEHNYDLQQNMPAIRKQIESGDIRGAVQAMTKIGIDPNIQMYYIKTTINPASRLSATQLQKFMTTATPEESQQMRRYLHIEE